MTNPALLDAILSRSTGKGSRVHGPAHWAGVAAAGYHLCTMTPEADPLVVLLFALLHDAMRQNDGYDPEHGKRGAELARELRDAGEFELDEERMRTLEEACTYHDKGRTSTDPAIGACWDADRLNLMRVWMKPDTRLLSTRAGRFLAGTNDPVLFAGIRFDWQAIFLNFDAAISGRPRGVYLRFGDVPADGISRGPRPVTPEHGVSVFEGYEDGPGSYSIDTRRLMMGTETRLVRWLLASRRPLYVVEGEPAGMGGSGEPLLTNARSVRRVGLADGVEVLPEHPDLRRCVQRWKAEGPGDAADGAHPGLMMSLPVLPFDRPATPSALYVNYKSPAAIVRQFREDLGSEIRKNLMNWAGPEAVKDYNKMKAENKARREAKREQERREREAPPVWQRAPLQSAYDTPNDSSWKESPWN